MQRRNFLRTMGAGALTPALRAVDGLAILRQADPGGSIGGAQRKLRLRLDGPSDGGAICAGPGNVYVTDIKRRTQFVTLDWTGGKLLSVTLQPDRPLAVHVYLALPEWGRTWVTLDNQGNGYVDDIVQPLSLMEEAYKSHVACCQARLAQTSQSNKSTPELDRADEAARKGDLVTALRSSLRAGEDIEETYVRGVFTHGQHAHALISGTLFGERKGPWAIGVGPDWPFGATPPDFLRPKNCQLAIAKLCNATTLPSFWRSIEPVPGEYAWQSLDTLLDFCDQYKIKAKSFAIYWRGSGGSPGWFRQLKFNEQKAAIERWTKAIVGRYRGRISAWETVNEMHDVGFFDPSVTIWTHDQILDVTRMVNDLVGALDPGTPRIINNCCLWGEDTRDIGQWLQPKQEIWCPLTFVERVIQHGIQFEGVGLQFYNPRRDLMECGAHLDRFRALGKPIWISEISVPSTPRKKEVGGVAQTEPDPLDGWRGPWSLERQADWTELWYSIVLARPDVECLNWWDMDDRQSYISSGGLLDSQCQPKPAFNRLMELCHRLKLGAPGG